jgi:hypothetical protein
MSYIYTVAGGCETINKKEITRQEKQNKFRQ